MENLLEGLKSRFELTEERLSELEDSLLRLSKAEKQKEKKNE